MLAILATAPGVEASADPKPLTTAASRALGTRLNLWPAAKLGQGVQASAPSLLAINLEVDLQILATSLVSALAPASLDEIAHAGSTAQPGALDRRGVNRLDRTVIGNDAGWSDALSDATLGTAMVAPYVASLIDALTRNNDWTGLGRDAVVLSKTLAINGLVCGLVKHMVRRPRPYLYDPEAGSLDGGQSDDRLSFYSGHTSWSFAMATSYSYIFTLHHPDSPWVLPVWLGSHALASTTAVMRVLAGKHFWSDVAVGAVVGSAIGLAVPHLHHLAATPGSSPATRFLAELRLVPTFYRTGGFGVNAMWYW